MKFFSCRYSRHQRFDRVSFGANFQTGKTTKRNSPSGSSSPVSSYGRLLLNSTWGKKGWKITFTLTNFNFNWMITVFWPCHFFYNSRVQGGPYFYTYPYPSMKGLYFPLNNHNGQEMSVIFPFPLTLDLGLGQLSTHKAYRPFIHKISFAENSKC